MVSFLALYSSIEVSPLWGLIPVTFPPCHQCHPRWRWCFWLSCRQWVCAREKWILILSRPPPLHSLVSWHPGVHVVVCGLALLETRRALAAHSFLPSGGRSCRAASSSVLGCFPAVGSVVDGAVACMRHAVCCLVVFFFSF